MGCDIHLYVEHRRDGVWQAADEFERDEDGLHLKDWTSKFYGARNYDLFSILADVRNDGNITPIAAPRGIPADASAEYKTMVEDWGCDGHSFSYHTLRQLLDFDWTTMFHKKGWINFETWEKWSRWSRPNGEGPDGWCAAVGGGRVRHLTAPQMDAVLLRYNNFSHEQELERQAMLNEHRHDYALAEWDISYGERAADFLTYTIPQLLKLAGGVSGVDDVRIVFFFDN